MRATAQKSKPEKERAEFRLHVEQDECAESPEWDDPGAWLVTTRNRHFESMTQDYFFPTSSSTKT